MPYSHVVSQSVAVSGTTIPTSAPLSYSGSGHAGISETVPVGTDADYVIAIDVSALKSIVIWSDRVITLETNDGSSADDTIVLKANVPYIWNTDSYDSCLLTTDVTVIYVTNASGGEAQLLIETIQDATP